jgi:hypothetical protein
VKCCLVSWLQDCCGSIVVDCCCEKLVSEVGDNRGTQRKGNICSLKLLPSDGSKDVTLDISVCVCVCNSEL